MTKASRIELIDAARGVAIIAMIGYHLLWDLTLYGFVPFEVILSPQLHAVQLTILSSFLLVSGASFALATRNGVVWQKFWRRLAMILAGALAITAATVWAFPETYVFFGVLHALVVFSLAGVVLSKLPTLAIAAIGVVVIVAPILWTNPVFMDRRLAWIGFYPESPPTNDLVPIFPWLGVFLLGFAGMRFWLERSFAIPAIRGGVLTWIGRWSLVIYLVHQPLLFAIVYPVSLLRPQPFVADQRMTEFIGNCEAVCAINESLDYCQRYCGCMLNATIEQDLWDELAGADPATAMSSVTATCTALASEL